MAKFPEDFEPVTGHVEDPKVYTCFCQKVEKTKAVTHADYRALEEELAALRGKTADVVTASTAARRELQSCQSVIHLHGGFDPAYVEGAQKAMRDLSATLDDLTRLQGYTDDKCTCPSGDGSLEWPCPSHPPSIEAPRTPKEQTK